MIATNPGGGPAWIVSVTPRMRWQLNVAMQWLPADASLKAARRLRKALNLDVLRDAADLAGPRGINPEHLVKGPALLACITEEQQDIITKLEAAGPRKTQQGEQALPAEVRMSLLDLLEAIEAGVTEADGPAVNDDRVEAWLPS